MTDTPITDAEPAVVALKATTGADGKTDDLDAAPEPEPTDGTTDTAGKGNPEAARWRKQFRTAEVELTVANARIEQMQRAEIQRVAGEVLVDGNDFWREPVELAGLLDEHGLPDPEAVRAHAAALIESHKHWARRGPATPAASSVTSDKSPLDGAKTATWGEFIAGKG